MYVFLPYQEKFWKLIGRESVTFPLEYPEPGSPSIGSRFMRIKYHRVVIGEEKVVSKKRSINMRNKLLLSFAASLESKRGCLRRDNLNLCS